MKALIILIRLIGLIFLVLAGVNLFWYFQASTSPATIVTVPTVLATKEETWVPTEVPPTEILPTEIPTPTATPLPMIQNYRLANLIDLASAKATAWSIRLPEGGELPGTWAKAIAYQNGDDQLPQDPFDTHAGTIDSIWGDTLVIQAHSGEIFYKWILFVSNFDLYLRKNSEGAKITLVEGQEKLQKLIGTTAYLCQTDTKVEPFTAFDPSAGCPGNVLELRIVAAAVVSQERVAEYDTALLNLRSWMSQNYPGYGFESVTADKGFLLVTCLQKYPYQPEIEGLDYWVYNRVVLGFEIVEVRE